MKNLDEMHQRVHSVSNINYSRNQLACLYTINIID